MVSNSCNKGKELMTGYGGDGVADPGPFVFDLPEGTWSTEYTPEPSPATAAAASTPVDSGNTTATLSAEATSISDTGQSGTVTPDSTDGQSTTDSVSGEFSLGVAIAD